SHGRAQRAKDSRCTGCKTRERPGRAAIRLRCGEVPEGADKAAVTFCPRQTLSRLQRASVVDPGSRAHDLNLPHLARNTRSAFERTAIPMRGIGRGLIGAL